MSSESSSLAPLASPSETFDVLLAQPRGFCAGVDRAIDIVERALEQFGAPIFVRHEIVQDRKSTRLNSSHVSESRMPSSA